MQSTQSTLFNRIKQQLNSSTGKQPETKIVKQIVLEKSKTTTETATETAVRRGKKLTENVGPIDEKHDSKNMKNMDENDYKTGGSLFDVNEDKDELESKIQKHIKRKNEEKDELDLDIEEIIKRKDEEDLANQDAKIIIEEEEEEENEHEYYIDECRKNYKPNEKYGEYEYKIDYHPTMTIGKNTLISNDTAVNLVYPTGKIKSVYEVLRANSYHLYFDFDFKENYEHEYLIKIIDNIILLRKHIGNSSIIGYTNDDKLYRLIKDKYASDDYVYVCNKCDTKKILSLHVVYYETRISQKELYDFAKLAAKNIDTNEFVFDANPYPAETKTSTKSLRHVYSAGAAFDFDTSKVNYDNSRRLKPSDKIKPEHTFAQIANKQKECVCELTCAKLDEIFKICNFYTQKYTLTTDANGNEKLSKLRINNANIADTETDKRLNSLRAIIKELSDNNGPDMFNLSEWSALMIALRKIDLPEILKIDIIKNEFDFQRIGTNGKPNTQNGYDVFRFPKNIQYDDDAINGWLEENELKSRYTSSGDKLLKIIDVINRLRKPFDSFTSLKHFISKQFIYVHTISAYLFFAGDQYYYSTTTRANELLKSVPVVKCLVKNEEVKYNTKKIVEEHRSVYNKVSFLSNNKDDDTYHIQDYFNFPFVAKTDYDNDLIESTLGKLITNLTNVASKTDSKVLNIWLRNWIRTIFRRPELLMGTSVMIRSQQGVGKNILTNLLCIAFGESKCLSSVNAENAFGQFNNLAEHKKIVVINEVHELTYSQYTAMKTLITEHRISINQKNIDPRLSDNVAACFLFTNDNVYISDGDRRIQFIECVSSKINEIVANEILSKIYVGETRMHKPNEEYFSNLLGWLLYSPYEKIEHEFYANIAPENTYSKVYESKAKKEVVRNSDKNVLMQEVLCDYVKHNINDDNCSIEEGVGLFNNTDILTAIKTNDLTKTVNINDINDFIKRKSIGYSFDIEYHTDDDNNGLYKFTVIKNERIKKTKGIYKQFHDKNCIVFKIELVAKLETKSVTKSVFDK